MSNQNHPIREAFFRTITKAAKEGKGKVDGQSFLDEMKSVAKAKEIHEIKKPEVEKKKSRRKRLLEESDNTRSVANTVARTALSRLGG